MNTYKTKGVCSKEINFEVSDDNILLKVSFNDGCSGNLQGISKLACGKNIDEVIEKLSGIKCRGKNSCPDQLAKALTEYKKKH